MNWGEDTTYFRRVLYACLVWLAVLLPRGAAMGAVIMYLPPSSDGEWIDFGYIGGSVSSVTVDSVTTGSVIIVDAPVLDDLGNITETAGPGPLDHFDVNVNGATQTTGVPIPVTVTARSAWGYPAVDAWEVAINFSIHAQASVSANLLGPQTPNGNAKAFAATTLGYSFTPSQDLVVTHVRHYCGTKVSLWTDTGLLLASQNVTGTPGTWSETPLAAPVPLRAGTAYRVGVFVPTGNTWFSRVTQPSATPFGLIGNPCWAVADGFPNTLSPLRWPLVDVRFTVQSEIQIATTPSFSWGFVQGVWSGTLTVLEAATNVVLQVTGGGKSGASSPFNIALGPPSMTNHPADVRRTAGKDLVLSAGATGGGTLAYQWWFNGSPVPTGTAPQLPLNNLSEGQSGLYWCSVANAAGSVTSRVARVQVGTAWLSAPAAPDVQALRTSGFELGLQMEVGRSYRIEGSTDLVNWVVITNFVSSGEAMQFVDRAATNLTRRFYRVVRQ